MLELLEHAGDIVLVAAKNEFLDAGNSQAFKLEFATLVKSGVNVVFVLSRVQFIDSSGCGAILSCLRQVKAAGGDMKVCSVSKSVRALFELVRLHRVVDIYNTPEEAFQAFDVMIGV